MQLQQKSADTASQALAAVCKTTLLQHLDITTPSWNKIIKFITSQVLFNKKPTPTLTIDQLKNTIYKYPFTRILQPTLQIKPHTSPTDSIKLSYLNINGKLTTKLRPEHPYAQDLLAQFQTDILMLAETRCTKLPTPPTNYTLLSHITATKSSAGYAHGGLAVFYKSHLTHIKALSCNPTHNIIWFSIQTEPIPTFICLLYIPTDTSEHITIRKDMFKTLQTDIANYYDKGYIMLCGDFNTRLGILTGDYTNNKAIASSNHSQLLNIRDKFHLTIENCKSQFGIPTFHRLNTRNQTTNTSIIDLLIHNCPPIDKFHILTHTWYNDHRPLCFHLNNVTLHPAVRSKYSFALNRPSDSANFELYEKTLAQHATKIRQCASLLSRDDTIPKSLAATIISIATYFGLWNSIIQAFGVHRITNANRWSTFNTKLHQAYSHHKLLLQENSTHATSTTAIHLQRSRQTIKNILFSEQSLKITNTVKSINSSPIPDRLKHFSRLIRTTTAQAPFIMSYENKDIPATEAFKLFYSNLFNGKSVNSSNWDHSEDQNIISTVENITTAPLIQSIPVPDIETIVNTLNSLKIKSPGLDMISNSYLKTCPESVANILLPFINHFWQTGSFGSILPTGVIIPIPKTPCPTNNPSKYRPITLLTTIYKFTEALILPHLNHWIYSNKILNPNQYGFTFKNNIFHPLSVIRTISEILPKNKKLYCALLDIQKAFDTVWREKLFVKLHNSGCPSHLLRLIIGCYQHTSNLVRTNNCYSAPLTTSCGVMQGSILSPSLYAFFINDLISTISSQTHNPILPTNICGFADDLNLLALSHQRLLSNVKTCLRIASINHYSFNLEKSHLFLFDRGLTLGRRIIINNQRSYKITLSEHKHADKNSSNSPRLPSQILLHKPSTTKGIKYLIHWLHPNPNIFCTSWESQSDLLRPWIKKYHKNQSYILPIYWYFTSPHTNCALSALESSFANNQCPLKIRKQVRYLGCWFTNLPDQQSILDSDYNFAIFKARYISKHQLFTSISNKYNLISHHTRIRLFKAFSLPYSILFSQVLPMFHQHCWKINTIHFAYISQFLQLKVSPKEYYLLSLFLRYMSPQWRWIKSKLNWFRAIRSKPNSVLSSLITHQLTSHAFCKQYGF